MIYYVLTFRAIKMRMRLKRISKIIILQNKVLNKQLKEQICKIFGKQKTHGKLKYVSFDPYNKVEEQPDILGYDLNIVYYKIQMSKSKNTSTSKRQSSVDNKQTIDNQQAKKSVNDKQKNYLLALKDKGKKGLIKLIPKPINFIKNLVNKGAVSIKNEIQPKLLPKLTINSMHSKIFQKIIPQQNLKFYEMNQSITSSMLFFQQNLQGEEGQAQLLRIQSQKCFKNIHQHYFNPQLSNVLEKILTRERQQSQQIIYKLGDYLDQVQFNVNQQVSYKMKIFMSFVNFLTNIGNLTELILKKISVSRFNNNILKEIVVQSSSRINGLRQKKQQMESILALLKKLKFFKKLQNHFISSVNTKGKIFMAETYNQYCKIHEEIKDYCCPRNLCKYWDVAYYMERGYQDSFSRSLKSYLMEIIILDQKNILNIMQPKKQQYETVKVGFVNFNDINLDQSYQQEEDIQLISKNNIQKEIISLFKQGLRKCSFSTDQICSQISKNIKYCFNKLLLLVKGKSQTLFQIPQINKQERKSIIQKIPLNKYIKIVQVWSQRMKKIIRRQVSIVEKGLTVAFELNEQFPEKFEIINSYLMQIIHITFQQIDSSFQSLMMNRDLKKQDSQSIRQILDCVHSWKELLGGFKAYQNVWLQFNAGQTLSQSQLFAYLMSKFEKTSKIKVQIMLSGYNHSTIEQLPLKLQQDQWKPVSIPNNFYHILGEVVFGNKFTKHNENIEKKMLSSSLILERNPSLMVSATTQKQKDSKRQESANSIESQYDLQMSENVITLDGQSFKILNSTMAAIGFLNGYLEWVDQLGIQQSLQSTILCKIMQFSIMYIKIVEDLIVKKQALKYGNIKSKSITGKHLLLTYSQLKLYNLIIQKIFKRFQKFSSFATIISDHITKIMQTISKKFKAILELSIRQSIDKIIVDPRKEIKGPVNETIQIVSALTKSADLVKDILFSVKQLGQFIGISWCNLYLQKIKTLYKSVYKMIMNSNGTRRSKDIDWSDNIYWKFKQLEYISQNLYQYKDNILGFQVLLVQLQAERKKLQRPQ